MSQRCLDSQEYCVNGSTKGYESPGNQDQRPSLVSQIVKTPSNVGENISGDLPHDDGAPGKRSGSPQPQMEEPSKRHKRTELVLNYGCPFRIRNPIRFNIRDCHNCAMTSFADISLVKFAFSSKSLSASSRLTEYRRHILIYHQRQQTSSTVNGDYKCSRCRARFPSAEERDSHLRVSPDSICPLLEVDATDDPEDGVTSHVDGILRDRRASTQILEWDPLWRVLFPGDFNVPSGGR